MKKGNQRVQPQNKKKQQSVATIAKDSTIDIKLHKRSSIMEKLPDKDNNLMFQPELRYERFTSGHRNTQDDDRYDGRSINVHREADITNLFCFLSFFLFSDFGNVWFYYTIFLLVLKQKREKFFFKETKQKMRIY